MDDTVLFSLRLSFQVAVIATFFVAIVGICIAYILSRADFRGKELLDILFTLPLVLPPTVVGYYLIILFGRNGYLGKYLHEFTGWSIMFTWYGAALASFVVALPLMIKTTRASFESVDKSLVDASYTLGHSELKTVLKVVLPLSKKGIIAGIVLSFARALGEFGATLMVAGNIPGKTNTMTLTIYSMANSGEWMKANVLVLFFTFTSGAFLYIANRFSKRMV
ncbi:molybdate ABC transporter permease subunit [Syntrophorhabdus aromaticivorans]|uniref:Molybdenum transport system permease n=1 Tax=Syntrophorhabdus aromaticivorans TaxID=328301 RepID=A0A971M2Y7_9BACT|nr:molybdate ABC transporter permease subunit [Syntrophorhabdus aromaticivorans]NLW34793.1 molybdate ABC transporter permease subunit [Syntrophorhabdus aromaticivorans]